MALRCFYLNATLFIVILGSLPCESDNKCSTNGIQHCRDKYYNEKRRCSNHRKIQKCFKTLWEDCKEDGNDLLREELTVAQVQNNKKINLCPVLMDGFCYHNEIDRCEEHVPYEVKDPKTTEEQIQRLCYEFESKYKQVASCVKQLRSLCAHTKEIEAAISESFQKVDEIKDKCYIYFYMKNLLNKGR